MFTPLSPRVSSRLAHKRKHDVGSRKDDIFEYTPIATLNKKDKGDKTTKVLAITKDMVKKYEQDKEMVLAPVATPLRKRGRPPKLKPLEHVEVTPTIQCTDVETPQSSTVEKSRFTSSVEDMARTVLAKQQRVMKTLVPSQNFASKSEVKGENIFTCMMQEFVSNLVQKSESPEFSDDEIFLITAGLLSAATASMITMETLKAVAMDTGVTVADHQNGVKVVFGSPKNLLDASQKLSTIVTEAKVERGKKFNNYAVQLVPNSNNISPNKQFPEDLPTLSTTHSTKAIDAVHINTNQSAKKGITEMNLTAIADTPDDTAGGDGEILGGAGGADSVDTDAGLVVLSSVITDKEVHAQGSQVRPAVKNDQVGDETKDISVECIQVCDTEINVPATDTEMKGTESNMTAGQDALESGENLVMLVSNEEATDNTVTEVAVDDDVKKEETDQFECVRVIFGAQEYVSNRQGPKRRQGRCRHGKDSCVLCPAYCQLCDYRSTEIAVRKHIQRVHPVNTFDCEICGMKFGIRYDMRRHRMVHFDDQGNLTEQTKNKLRNGGKSDMLDIKLFQLELNFTALPEENSANEDPMKDNVNTTLKHKKQPMEFSTNEIFTPIVNKLKKDLQDVMCGFCDYKGTLTSIEIHHKSRHKVPDITNMEHVCPACDQSFSLDQLKQHYQEICSKQEGNYKDLDLANMVKVRCMMCGVKGTAKIIKTHIEDHSMKIQCCQCDYTGAKELMKMHLKSHKTKRTAPKLIPRNPPKESSVIYKCAVCSNIFKTRASLQLHFNSHERATTLYKCEHCNFESTRFGQFKAHVRRKHAALEDRKCNICEKVFNQVTSLLFHKESVHGIGRVPHKCEHCKKQFTTKRFLQVHIKRIHYGEKPFVCSLCPKGFFERSRMLEHENVHLSPAEKEAKKHICSYCGKGYSQKGVLKQHENIHLGLRPYKCNICGKSFTFTAELHKHKVSHSSHRPHICVHCGKGFKFPYKLTAHLVTHTKQGRHFCQVCDKVYTSLSSLRKHQCRGDRMPPLQANDKRHLCMTCNSVFLSLTMLQKHQCQGSPNGSLLIFSDMVQMGSNSLDNKDDVMKILGEAVNSEIIPAESVITLTTEPLDGIVTSEGQLDGCDVKMEDIKPVYDITEGIQSSVLYMCCVCNKLFTDQMEVNSHMEMEHGSEAIIGQDFNQSQKIAEQFPIDSGEVVTLDNGNNSILVTEEITMVTDKITE